MEFLLHDMAQGLRPSDRHYAESKLRRLSRLLPTLDEVELRHDADKLAHRAEVLLRAGGKTYRVGADRPTLREAVDVAVSKAAEKLRRVHQRLKPKASRR